MLEGKKVRRGFWTQGEFIRRSTAGFFRDSDGHEVVWLLVSDLLAEDWEEFVWIN